MIALLAATMLQPSVLPRFADKSALVPSLANAPAAWGDANADGRPDLYCAGTLFLNTESAFQPIAVPGAGVGILADLNQDGQADIISTSPIAIFLNVSPRGAVPTFEPRELPALPPTVCLAAAAADLNRDGVPDLYFAGYEDWHKQITYPSFVLLSNKDGRHDLAATFSERRSRGVTACDFDENGTVDLYVSNYRLQPNQLWINDGTGRLTDAAAERNVLATSNGFPGGHSIGACWGDFNGDGRFDLFAGNFAHVDSRGNQPKSRFLRNRGPSPGPAFSPWSFDDLGDCGVWYQESYASPAAADFDNDGRLDLYFTTVYADASFGKKNYPVLYRSEIASPAAPEWRFVDDTSGSGLEQLPATDQAAWADYDADGLVDLVTAGRLFRNTGPARAWLLVRVDAPQPIGTQVRLSLPDGRVLSRHVEAGTGQGNSNSPILHFGLGDLAPDATVSLSIRWPDGTTEARANMRIGQIAELRPAAQKPAK
jgi:hypothetical protein